MAPMQTQHIYTTATVQEQGSSCVPWLTVDSLWEGAEPFEMGTWDSTCSPTSPESGTQELANWEQENFLSAQRSY